MKKRGLQDVQDDEAEDDDGEECNVDEEEPDNEDVASSEVESSDNDDDESDDDDDEDDDEEEEEEEEEEEVETSEESIAIEQHETSPAAPAVRHTDANKTRVRRSQRRRCMPTLTPQTLRLPATGWTRYAGVFVCLFERKQHDV